MKFKNIVSIIRSYKANQIDKRITRKFFMLVSIIVGTYLIAAIAITALLLTQTTDTPIPPSSPLVVNTPAVAIPTPEALRLEEFEELEESLVSRRTNVLILGLDIANLADVIIAASFEHETGDLYLLSIPRDTFTQMPQSRINNMTENGLWVPSNGIMKINAVRSLSRRGGRDFGPHFIMEQLSENLGVRFDYYVEFNLAAFRAVVDLVGGVEIEVRQHMFYHDPYQDLLIDIRPGTHLMNGRTAEHFVRYRPPATGDIGRINSQQEFMTQLFRQVLDRDTIMGNPLEFLRIAFNYVDSNIGFNLFRYIPYVGSLSAERIFTYTLPGDDTRIAGLGSVWMPNYEITPHIIDRIFFGIESEISTILVADRR
ncbi:MAG: LCP family protein [Turicibacter sp.]|nr:LCP family protein [Turicibacter sp.]